MWLLKGGWDGRTDGTWAEAVSTRSLLLLSCDTNTQWLRFVAEKRVAKGWMGKTQWGSQGGWTIRGKLPPPKRELGISRRCNSPLFTSSSMPLWSTLHTASRPNFPLHSENLTILSLLDGRPITMLLLMEFFPLLQFGSDAAPLTAFRERRPPLVVVDLTEEEDAFVPWDITLGTLWMGRRASEREEWDTLVMGLRMAIIFPCNLGIEAVTLTYERGEFKCDEKHNGISQSYPGDTLADGNER